MTVKTTRSRATGALVTLGRSAELGVNEGDPATRWSLICEDHGETIGFDSAKLARSFAAAPDDWCEGCRGVVRADRLRKLGELGELVASMIDPVDDQDEDSCGIVLGDES